MKPWIERYGPWIALFVASAAYYSRFIHDPDNGVLLYSQAAQCLIDNRILQECSQYFTYPPALAFVFVPLVQMPMGLRLLIWYVVTIAASVGAFKCAEVVGSRLFAERFSATEMAWVRVIAIILSLKFVLAVLENQAYEALSFIFIMLGLVGLSERRELLGGAAIGVAAALKATPLVFFPYLLVKRRFAAAAAFLAAMLVVGYSPDLVFTPTGGAHGYFNTWLQQVAGASVYDPNLAKLQFWTGANAFNHSLRGAVSLQIDDVKQAGLHKLVLYGLDFAFMAFAAALIMLRKAERDMLAIDASILLIAMLMLSPMTSRSHYEVLVLPYVMLSMVVLRDRVTHKLGIAVLAVSFFFLTATSNDVVGKPLSDWAYFHSFLVIGALTLMIYIAVIVWEPAVLREAKPFAWRWPRLARA
jgi:hypothetical protein